LLTKHPQEIFSSDFESSPMKISYVLGVFALVLGSVCAVFGYFTYRDWRSNSTQPQSMMATQQQVIAAAQRSEETREKELATTLGQIAALKQKTQTPADVLHALPSYLRLPEPLQAVPYEQAIPVKQGSNATIDGAEDSKQIASIETAGARGQGIQMRETRFGGNGPCEPGEGAISVTGRWHEYEERRAASIR